MRGKLILLAALLPCLGQAAVVVIATNFRLGPAAQGTTNPVVFNGALAPAGQGIIAVGFFGATDAAIAAANGNVAGMATVAASFQQFGATSTMGTGSGAAPGTAGLFQVTPGAQTAGTPFSGKNVYVAIGNGATLLASTQMVVFKSTTTFADEPTPSVNAFLADTAPGQLPDGQLLLGVYGAPKVYYSTGPLANQLLSGIVGAGSFAEPEVPEPTMALLGVLGTGLGLIRRRVAWA